MSSVRSSAGEAVTRVILSTFRAHGMLLLTGDRIAAGAGLTSARWQVLGAIVLARRPLTAPQIARRMGLTRQSVHATVRRLVHDGLVKLVTNADHRRSQLVDLTDSGRAAYAAMDRRQAVWVNDLARGISETDLHATARVLDHLCQVLDNSDATGATTSGGGSE